MARILALDDSTTMLTALQQALAEHDVVTCTDWTDANRHLHQGAFDLVLVDQFLDSFKGTFFVRAVRSFFGPDLPIVVLSSQDVAAEALEAGATHFLSKAQLDRAAPLVASLLGFNSASP